MTGKTLKRKEADEAARSNLNLLLGVRQKNMGRHERKAGSVKR